MFPFVVLAKICQQAHHDRRQGFRMVSHLQRNNTAKLVGRIIYDVGKIAVQREQNSIESLGTLYDVRIFRVYWKVTAQQLDFVSCVSKRLAY